MNTPQTKQQKGFTIIEVVLVLAIAGLIFLMVFVALPSLQKGQKDAQRKQDLARISTQITNYVTNTRGAVPKDANSLGNFVRGYLKGDSATVAGEEYKDPNGELYKIQYGVVPTELNTIGYQAKSSCADDGSGTFKQSNAARDFALTIKLENQEAPYCVDSKTSS
jgi:prepilin-type N-terminal cleavage/methylation domain-containing protein